MKLDAQPSSQKDVRVSEGRIVHLLLTIPRADGTPHAQIDAVGYEPHLTIAHEHVHTTGMVASSRDDRLFAILVRNNVTPSRASGACPWSSCRRG